MINAVVIFLWLVVAFLWHINRYIEKTPIDYRDIIIIVIGGIFITLNYFLIQVTFRPFEKLTETMNRVAGGDLKIRAEQTQGETHFIQEFEQAFNQMLDALEKERKHSQWLAGQVISAQEEERKRISRELHDETNQILVMLNIGLERLKISCAVCSKTDRNRQNMVEEADNLKDLSETALASLRNLAYHLRPSVLDDLGLKAALLWIARQHLEKQGIQVKFSWKIENERLPPEIEATFFRLAQEAISNIVKHSNARHVNLSFYSTQGSFVLEIRDDGIGFNLHEDSSFDGENKAHIGLLGMQERVKILSGKFEVVSSPGHGCHIKASIPVPGRVALLT
jgi:two-component system sensor histidine kinase UhpB